MGTRFTAILTFLAVTGAINTYAATVINWTEGSQIDWNTETEINWGADNRLEWEVGGRIYWELSLPPPETEPQPRPIPMLDYVGTSAISSNVKRFADIITDCVSRYGIPAFKPLADAVCMQESSGGVYTNDIFQSSESRGLAPNTIQDAALSTEYGISYLAEVLRMAGVTSPDDINGIRLALAGYNMGSGFIPWCLERYEGYTPEAPAEYSEMQKRRLGVDVYGDPLYPEHVLRYYQVPMSLIWDGSGVHPELQAKIKQLKDMCAAENLPVKITSTWRSEDEQNYLYALGRTIPGDIVTQLPYPYSKHNWGLAVDFCRNVPGQEYRDNDGFFGKVGNLGRQLGLT